MAKLGVWTANIFEVTPSWHFADLMNSSLSPGNGDPSKSVGAGVKVRVNNLFGNGGRKMAASS